MLIRPLKAAYIAPSSTKEVILLVSRKEFVYSAAGITISIGKMIIKAKSYFATAFFINSREIVGLPLSLVIVGLDPTIQEIPFYYCHVRAQHREQLR